MLFHTKKKIRFTKIFSAVFQIQLSISLGFLLSFLVSLFYFFINDPRFPKEKPELLLLGFLISLLFFLFGNWLSKKDKDKDIKITLKEGAFIILFVWFIAGLLSSLVFFLSGFPDPNNLENFSLFRRIVDSFFESVSGYTTAGGSILPSVEAFPKGILMWRSTTHFLGGIGIAYLAVSLWKRFSASRTQIINNEVEGPNMIEFKSEDDAVKAGKKFLKIYSLITLALITLLFISGSFFRQIPYDKWYDNAFDSVNFSFSVMGTGGFAPYSSSVGISTANEEGIEVKGGLKNPTSEWIIALFMFFAGINFSLWYILIFKRKNWRKIVKNKELKVYASFVIFLVLAIWMILVFNKVYPSAIEALRYAFFNVATITSTTGLGNTDFTTWPTAAYGLLFIAYLIGGMVGSTASGPKILRLVIMFKYTLMKLKNFVYGKYKMRFKLDGIMYKESTIGLIVVSLLVYYMIFLIGSVVILILSPENHFPDGTVKQIDFIAGITASIANLGHIGPVVAIGNINAGPTGNYFSFSESAKLFMTVLMFIGRVGVITIMTIFVSQTGLHRLKESVHEQTFDSDEPLLRK